MHLSTTFGQDVNQDPEIVLLDNPGCDENGSDIIISSIVKAKRSSAAFIFVTTFQQYRTMACSKALQNIFLQNPGTCYYCFFLRMIHLNTLRIFCVVRFILSIKYLSKNNHLEEHCGLYL